MIACKILNPTLEGAYQVSGSFQFFNIIEGGGSGSMVFQGFTAYMIGNIFRAPATHTASMTSGSASVGVNMNNIYYGGSATTYSVNGSAAPNPTAAFWGYNVHKNITSPYNQDYSAKPELQVGQGDITEPTDAQIDWTDPDNDDYTIASADSVLIDAGITPGLL
jgi:hypothetical protein